jgi:hypothetical protein
VDVIMGGTDGDPYRAQVSAGRDFSMQGANIVGGSQHIGDHVHGDKVGRDKVIKNNVRVRLGLGALALVVLGGGGYFVTQQVVSSPTDVVHEKGLEGAANTVSAIKQAEIDSNAADWCVLASGQSGDTCRNVMSSAFGTLPELRGEIAEVGFGAVSGSGNSAQVEVSFRGKKMGIVPMRWDGKRWEVEHTFYLLAVNNGGLAMSAVLTFHECGVILGMSTECKK